MFAKLKTFKNLQKNVCGGTESAEFHSFTENFCTISVGLFFYWALLVCIRFASVFAAIW
jgi:hypothetical protein